MSNLLKQYYVVHQTADKRVINSNGLVEERIRQFAMEKKASGAGADSGEAGSEGSGEFVQGLGAMAVEVEPQPDPEETARQILADARDQADQILNDAHMKAQQMLADADAQAEELFEEQKAVGYSEGAKAREEELAEMERRLQDERVRLEMEIEGRSAELDSEFQMRLEEMEADIIDALIPVFAKVFHIELGNRRDILLALVLNTIMNVEIGDRIRIRVNEADKKMLGEHLDEIRGQVGADVALELVLDSKLSDGQCQIETSYGVFDCGIDMQFDNLVKDIRALV